MLIEHIFTVILNIGRKRKSLLVYAETNLEVVNYLLFNHENVKSEVTAWLAHDNNIMGVINYG